MPHRLPNFFLIGAPKSGTTSLYDYLRQHPSVFMPDVKEPRYMAYADAPPPMNGPGDAEANREAVYTRAEYEALFAEAEGTAARGEASVNYLYSDTAPARIHDLVPDAQLFAVLRNPIERAYSHYLHLLRSGREPLDSFGAALDAEERRREEGWEWSWHYQAVGYYHQQVRRYLEHFDRDQLTIHLFDDFTDDPMEVTQDIYRQLGVDPSFEPDTTVRRRTTGVPLSNRFQQFLYNPDNPLRRLSRYVLPEAVRDRWLTRLKNANLRKPPLSDDVRARLAEAFHDDVHRLERLLDRDLSHWLAPDATP